MKADMHMHSCYSDGSYWPQALATMAATAAGLTTWASVEIDCIDEGLDYRSEILGYFPDGHYAATEELLLAGRKERARTMEALFERAKVLFSAPLIDESDLRYSKTDLFLALLEAGVIPGNTVYREFRWAYFDTGLFADVRFSKPELADVVTTILSDGGIPVLPHVGHEFGDSARLMRSRGFFCTYGSDFHGPGSNKTQFGSFHGDFKGFPRHKARRKG